MEPTHEPNHNILTVILLFVGFITNLMSHAINNYDYWFKVFSLLSLGLAIVVNLGKAIKIFWGYFVSIYQWIKKK